MSKGRFLLVETEDGHQQIVFSHASSIVRSTKDPKVVVAEPTGGEAVIHGKIVKELG